MGEQILLTFTDEAGSRKFMAQVDAAFVIDRYLPTVVSKLGLAAGAYVLRQGNQPLDGLSSFERAGVRSGARLVLAPRPRDPRMLVIFSEPDSGRSRAIKIDSTVPCGTFLMSVLEQLEFRRDDRDPDKPPYSLKLKRTGKWIADGKSLQEAGVQEGDTVQLIRHPRTERITTAGAGREFLDAYNEYKEGRVSRTALDHLAPGALRDASAPRDRICTIAWRLRLRSAIPEILNLLGLPDPKIQWSAVEALGRLRAREAIPRLLPFLKTEKLAGAAARSLAMLNAADAVPQILELLRSPDPAARGGAAEALALLHAEASVAELRALLDDPEPVVRTSALRALSSLDAFQTVPPIARLCDDPDDRVRTQAVESLGLLGTEEVVQDLVRKLDDRDPMVRETAIHALATQQARSKLSDIQAMLSDRDPHVRAAAVKALAALQARDLVPTLVSLLRDRPSADVPARDDLAPFHVSVVEALAELKCRETIPDLLPLLKDENEFVRWHAAAALGKLGAPESHPVILEFLKHRDLNYRMTAAMTAGELKLRAALPQVIALLNDDEPLVRGGAASEIGSLAGPEAIAPLVSLLADDVPMVREAAAGALTEMGAKDAIPSIVKLLKHPRPEVRESALEAIVPFKDPGTIPAIVPLLEDQEGFVRAMALYVLGELNATASLPEVLLLLRDPQQDVRVAAANVACLFGSTEGIRTLLDHAPNLFSLNAIRRPDLWKRLAERPFPRTVKCPARQMADEISAALGAALTFDLDATGRLKEWMSHRVDFFGASVPVSWLDVVGGTFGGGPCEAILESDRIHLLPRERARHFWRDERSIKYA